MLIHDRLINSIDNIKSCLVPKIHPASLIINGIDVESNNLRLGLKY